MEKFRVRQDSNEIEMQQWLNKQAEEGYYPILLAGSPYVHGNKNDGTFMVIVEHRPEPAEKDKIRAG